MKNQSGFTLIEMMIVMMIISTLLLITIPNVTKNNAVVKDKGCEAMIKLVETQLQAYEIEKHTPAASLDELKTTGYINSTTCPSGEQLTLTNGVVSIVVPTT